VLGGVATITDITAMHDLQQQQEDFLHIVSHDLRQPLSVMHGYLQLLEPIVAAIGTTQDTLHKGIAAITRSVQRMNVMIQDLADATRLAGGQLVLSLEPIDLGLDIMNLLERMAESLAVARIETDIAPDLPPVLADHDRLERILLNLLSNALKYSPRDTPVRLRARRVADRIAISVIDQGRGIAPEDLPHLFARFYRGKGERRTEGIGLGLYITKLLVEAHGGHISVESAPGHGSTFTVTLPIALGTPIS
jgi:signal transduction histidine kinase